ncbi:MAG: hypothetical protein RLZZ385_2301 [Pseudomonadota bacterium]|jgi:hypothetical protein
MVIIDSDGLARLSSRTAGRWTLVTTLVLAIGLIAGCTSREMYESVQHSRQAECQRLPIWQQKDCLALYDTPFEDYQRERSGESTGSEPLNFSDPF